MRLVDLLIVYGNWRARFPTAVSRTTHTSNALSANPKLAEHHSAVSAISEKITHGVDLTPHLSRRVGVAYQRDGSSIPHQRRQDLDLLVADWGIHHLHLSCDVEGDGFMTRGDDLLFAAFTATDAYLLDVLPHNSWTEIRLLEILVREWPESGVLISALSNLRLVEGPSDEERRRLRNAGVAQPVEIDGTVYLPRGQTTGGTPIDVTQRAHQLMSSLDEWRDDPQGKLDRLRFANRTAFWRPAVQIDQVGFTDGTHFVAVGALA